MCRIALIDLNKHLHTKYDMNKHYAVPSLGDVHRSCEKCKKGKKTTAENTKTHGCRYREKDPPTTPTIPEAKAKASSETTVKQELEDDATAAPHYDSIPTTITDTTTTTDGAIVEPAGEEDVWKIIEQETPKNQISPNFELKKLPLHLRDTRDDKTRLALLQGLHVGFWFAPVHEMQTLLYGTGRPVEILRLSVHVVLQCKSCGKYRLPMNKALIKAAITIRFNRRVMGDLSFMWDKIFNMYIDGHLRYKICDELTDKLPITFLHSLMGNLLQFFGPMEYFVSDQEGAITSDMVGMAVHRYSIKRLFVGVGGHTGTGLVDSHIRLTKWTAYKLRADAKKEGMEITDKVLVQEAGGRSARLGSSPLSKTYPSAGTMRRR